MSLVGAIILVTSNTRATELKLQKQIKQSELKIKDTHNQQIENLKKEIESVRQSKAAEKARIAAENAQKAQERTLAQRVVQSTIPTANAAIRPVSGSCSEWMIAAGVTDMVNAAELIRRESGCNPNAVNRSSGACGIPQALPCSKLGTNDPVAQIRWMQNYVNARYGGWAGAVAWHNSHNWY